MWSKLVHKISSHHSWGRAGTNLKPQVGHLRIICVIIKVARYEKDRKISGLKGTRWTWRWNQNYVSFKLVGQENGESEFMACETKFLSDFLQLGKVHFTKWTHQEGYAQHWYTPHHLKQNFHHKKYHVGVVQMSLPLCWRTAIPVKSGDVS